MEKALISQKELALDLKAMRVWLFESGGSFIYFTWTMKYRISYWRYTVWRYSLEIDNGSRKPVPLNAYPHCLALCSP